MLSASIERAMEFLIGTGLHRDKIFHPLTNFVTNATEDSMPSARVILLANSKSSNFNDFQSGYPGETTK